MPPAGYTLEDQRRMARARNYIAWQSRMVARHLGQRVVEIGCGMGNFTGTLLDRELVVAVDVEPACLEQLRERYRDRTNLRTLVCDAGGPGLRRLAEYRVDSCVCLNVLEHVEDDLRALRGMESILVTGGVVVLMVPAFPSLCGPIDRNLGHYRRYTRGGIARLAQEAGLRVRQARYMNAIGFFGWWVNAHILKREEQSARQIAIFDGYLVPLVSAVEAVIPPPFGQSLLVVLEKP